MILKNVCPSPVSSRVESYEGRDRVLRPPHRHRLLRRLQWWMWAAVSPAAGSSGGWPHPLQHPDVLWVREHTHHFLFLFHDSNCFIIIFFPTTLRCVLVSHVASGQVCRWDKLLPLYQNLEVVDEWSISPAEQHCKANTFVFRLVAWKVVNFQDLFSNYLN